MMCVIKISLTTQFGDLIYPHFIALCLVSCSIACKTVLKTKLMSRSVEFLWAHYATVHFYKLSSGMKRSIKSDICN